jgi:hypothetical protein
VLAVVVSAKQELSGAGKHNAYVCLRAASVA